MRSPTGANDWSRDCMRTMYLSVSAYSHSNTIKTGHRVKMRFRFNSPNKSSRCPTSTLCLSNRSNELRSRSIILNSLKKLRKKFKVFWKLRKTNSKFRLAWIINRSYQRMKPWSLITMRNLSLSLINRMTNQFTTSLLRSNLNRTPRCRNAGMFSASYTITTRSPTSWSLSLLRSLASSSTRTTSRSLRHRWTSLRSCSACKITSTWRWQVGTLSKLRNCLRKTFSSSLRIVDCIMSVVVIFVDLLVDFSLNSDTYWKSMD